MTTLLLLCLAADWPQFRGPGGAGVITSPVPAIVAESPAWRTELPGRGWSSPVLAGELLWMTTALDDGHDLRAIAVDAASGRIVHDVGLLQPAAVKEIHGENSYASPTPCMAGGRVFCHFGRYGTAAVDAATGEVLWRDTSHVIEHGGGPGSSPVVAAGLVVLTLDGADAAYVVALDPATGEEVWRRDRSAPKRPNPIMHRAFATPLVTTWNGREIVVSPGADQLHAYDGATGEELWHVRYVGFSTVPQPARWNDRILFCTGFFKPSLVAVELGGQGDVTDTQTAWRFKGPVPDLPSPLVALDHVWLVSDKGVLTAVSAATGKRADASRLSGNYSSSPLFVPGDDRSGQIWVGNRGGELLQVDVAVTDDDVTADVAKRIDLREAIYATPAASDGSVWVRTETALWCWKSAGD